MSKEAMKLALEALEDLGMKHFESTGEALHKEVFDVLKEALSKQEQGEPAAKYIGEGNEGSLVQLYDDVKKGTDFYTTPQQRKPLTEEQLIDLWPSLIMHQHTYAFARAIEAAHGIKEKNT